jgi:hypothetical protein
VISLRLPKTSYTSHLAHLSCTSCPKFTNLTTQADLLSLLVVVPSSSSSDFLIVLWHPWLRTYHPISKISSMLSKFSRTFIFMVLTNPFSPCNGRQILIHCNSASWWFKGPQLDKRPNQEPATTSVLVRLAELVLTLSNFSFDGEHYQQINGEAMRTKMGPNYANLFLGFVEKKSLRTVHWSHPWLPW